MSGPAPKLTREQALAIRKTYAAQLAGMTTLAARYRVSVSLISRIVKGQYASVSDQPDIARPSLRGIPGRFAVTERWNN